MNYFILSGAMGGGKSTILKALRKLGLMAIDEPARQILAEQRSIEGDGVPDRDQKLFTDLLLSRSISQFHQMQEHQGPVIFDRGIPDNIAYADLFGISTKTAKKAADKAKSVGEEAGKVRSAASAKAKEFEGKSRDVGQVE